VELAKTTADRTGAIKKSRKKGIRGREQSRGGIMNRTGGKRGNPEKMV